MILIHSHKYKSIWENPDSLPSERGEEVRTFSESISEMLKCYGNFVLRIEFENK